MKELEGYKIVDELYTNSCTGCDAVTINCMEEFNCNNWFNSSGKIYKKITEPEKENSMTEKEKLLDIIDRQLKVIQDLLKQNEDLMIDMRGEHISSCSSINTDSDKIIKKFTIR